MNIPESVLLQDIPVHGFTGAAALLDAVAALRERGGATVSYVNIHVLNVAAHDARLTDFLRGVDICYVDGKGVVWGAAVLGRRLPGRMTGADWIHDLARRAAGEGWRLGWVGGEDGVTAAAAAVLQAEHPALQVALTHHGYFAKTGPESDALVEAINAAGLDVLLVGMGTPIQEHWVAEVRGRLSVPVVWCLGATADFISGRVRRGPTMLVENQEWLARLLVDPRRLWWRFLVGNPRFLARMLRHRLQASGSKTP